MKETIILAPGVNGTELLKSLAKHGKNCINLRICNGGELARMALMRSGIAIAEDFADYGKETLFIAEAVQGEEYFENVSYSDIQKIATSIRTIRNLVADGDECQQIEEILKKGDFVKKNAALISIYKKYMKILKDKRMVDSAGLVRRAVEKASPFDAEFLILKEYKASPLEKALIKRLSKGNVKEKSIIELFGISEKTYKVDSFKDCYGAPNEVETILADIYSGKNLDECTVTVTDSGTYSQLFFDYALLYNLPITFGCGIPIINSYPARLLKLYQHWMTDGFFGADAVKAMLSSEAFDKSKLKELNPDKDEKYPWSTFYQMLGNIRFTKDKSVNIKRINGLKKVINEEEEIDKDNKKALEIIKKKKQCLPLLEKMADEFTLNTEEFVLRYAYTRKMSGNNSETLLTKLDAAALNTIYDEMSEMRSSTIEMSDTEMIQNVLKLSIGGGSSEDGKLFVTDIDGGLSAVRKNLYIAGLSASNYPGVARENYIVLDTDISLFGDQANDYMSLEIIINKGKNLLKLVQLYSGLDFSVNVSFPGKDVSGLKDVNASSLIYELIDKQFGEIGTVEEKEKKIQKIGYFDPLISKTRGVGKAYSEGFVLENPKSVSETDEYNRDDTVDNIEGTDKKNNKNEADWKLINEYSPTALGGFFNCPKAFLLRNILEIPEPEEKKPFEVISAAECGTLAHLLMEELANSDMGIEKFLTLSEKYFDRFILEHPALLDEAARDEKKSFLDMMRRSFEMDPHEKVVLKEKDIQCTHEIGIKLHGYPDRVEEKDGTFKIVDFKSGRVVKHKENDIDTCLQAIIYAYLMEKEGYNVTGGEFWYIRLGEKVPCIYDAEMKKKLGEKLERFKEQMINENFPISPFAIDRGDDDPNPCEYCKYGMICGKDALVGGADDE